VNFRCFYLFHHCYRSCDTLYVQLANFCVFAPSPRLSLHQSKLKLIPQQSLRSSQQQDDACNKENLCLHCQGRQRWMLGSQRHHRYRNHPYGIFQGSGLVKELRKQVVIQARPRVSYRTTMRLTKTGPTSTALETSIDIVDSNITTSTIGLTSRGSKHMSRNFNEEYSEETWYKPSKAIVIKNGGRNHHD
jgi:hypothetical protein